MLCTRSGLKYAERFMIHHLLTTSPDENVVEWVERTLDNTTVNAEVEFHILEEAFEESILEVIRRYKPDLMAWDHDALLGSVFCATWYTFPGSLYD